MSYRFEFEEELDEAVIDIDLENIQTNNSIFYIVSKRIIDIIGSLAGLILLSPLFLIVAILIKLEDPKGNIIFSHMRVGKDGKLFPCLKFRSMFANAEEMKKNFTEEQKKEYEETFKLQNDPRVTKVGRFIRQTSLDDFPQLINILKGEMTLVGPRPIVTDELVFYGEYQRHYKSVKPGLTGLWQVNGRSDTTYDERVAFDMEYIRTRNILKDIKIIIMTVLKVIKKEGAC